MDNLTHTLCGAALAKTRLGKLSPFAMPTLIVAANLPDIDILARFWGEQSYLAAHRGITHSIVGVVALAIAMGIALFLIERRFAPGYRAGLGRAIGLSCVGLATHPLLDFTNSYGWRPFLPFDATWYYGDLLFIADPWIWLLFGAATALAGERTRRGSIWLSLAVVAAIAVMIAAKIDARAVASFGIGVAAIAVLRALKLGRRHADRVVAICGALFAAYLGFLAWAGHRAIELGRAAASPELAADAKFEKLVANPLAADPIGWRFFGVTEREILVTDVELARGAGTIRHLDRGVGDPLVERAFAADCTGVFRGFARLPFAQVIERADGKDVHLMDARYQLAPGADPFESASSSSFDSPPKTHSTTRPKKTWSSAVVEFDRDGRLLGCEH